MNLVCKGLALVALCLCAQSLPTLIQQDSFMSSRLQRTVADFVQRADCSGVDPQKIFTALQYSGLPIVAVHKVVRPGREPFYRLAYEPPTVVIRTPYGDIVGTQSKKIYEAACYNQCWLERLVVCCGSARDAKLTVAWLLRQEPVALVASSVRWENKNCIVLARRDQPEFGRCLLVEDQDIDVARWNALVAHAQHSEKNNAIAAIYDFRFAGMNVLSQAQKNRRGGEL